MSGINVYDKKVEGLCNHHLKNTEFILEIESYYGLMTSSYGPKNGMMIIRNSAGADFLTSSSQKILQQLSFSHPCFKFINALIGSQNKAHGVHGLFVGALCSGLLARILKNEEFISYRIIANVSEWIQSALLDKLLKMPKIISSKIELNKLGQVLCIVRGILQSKSWHSIGLSPKEKEHIILKTVEAFLKTIPEHNEKEFGSTVITTVEGPPLTDSCIIDGILYREPDYNINEIQLRLKAFPDRNLKIIIFNVPLSDDTKEKHIIEWGSKLSLENSFSTYLFLHLKAILKDKGIHIILSQKYIQESLKHNLEREGYLVLERLGTAHTKALVEMAGCCPVTSLLQIQSSIESFIGCVSSVKAVTLGEKTYINILPFQPYKTITFILTGIEIHAFEFMKETIESSMSILQRMFVNSSVVAGGGCLESFAALVLKDLKEENLAYLAECFDASFTNIKMVFDSYIETFLRLSIIPTGGKRSQLLGYFVDSVSFHLWKFEESEIWEDKINALPPGVDYFCSCKCISGRDLPPETRFIPLVSIRNSERRVRSWERSVEEIDKRSTNTGHSNANNFEQSECREKFSNDSTFLEEISPMQMFHLRSESIVDSLPAKIGAIRLAFNGVAELCTIGRCIFDKK